MYVDFLAEKQVLDAHIDTMIIVQAKEAHRYNFQFSIQLSFYTNLFFVSLPGYKDFKYSAGKIP